MRFFLLLSLLISGYALSQPAQGILNDTTLQGSIERIDEAQYNKDDLSNPAWKYRYYFDGKGHILREEKWKEDGFQVRWNRKYDDQGNLTEHIRENRFQEVDKDSFAYNDQGNLTYQVKDLGGPFPKTTQFQYDASGNKVREERYVSGDHKGTYYYHYEGPNMVMTEWQYNDKKREIEWNLYDKQGRITKSTKLNIRGNEVKDTCKIFYEYPSGMEKLIQDECKPQTEKIMLNESGQEVHKELTRKVRRGTDRTIIKRSFNPQGQVINKQYSAVNKETERSYTSETIYEYEYDQNDNWVRIDWYEVEDGKKKLNMRFTRDITYSK